MKLFLPVSCMAAVALLGLLPSAGAANTPKTNKAPVTTAKTNSYDIAELPIPSSSFDVAQKPSIDPFYPLSTRQPFPHSVTNAPVLAFSATSFSLKGLSGSSGHPLALINNRTVAPGEDAEVTTTTGKVKIHCMAIRAESVVLRVSSQHEPIEIFLRKAAR